MPPAESAAPDQAGPFGAARGGLARVDFRKERAGAPAGFFACEAAGLRWLTVPGGPPTAKVLAVDDAGITLERLAPVAPDAATARALGAALARMHDAGAPAFGAPPDGWDGDGFFGPLEDPLPLLAGEHDRWGEFYAGCRVSQVRDELERRGRLDATLARDLDAVAGHLLDGRWDDDDPPARVHGDLWSGNVVWTAEGAVLIDPAAHGGHRMTDLAMLELFGLPHLAEVRAGYGQVRPLPAAYRELVDVHQVYPLGMHAVLFGSGYVRQLAGLVARLA